MSSLIRKSALLKALLLSNGVRVDRAVLTDVGIIYKESHFGYNDPHWCTRNIAEIMSPEAILPGGIVVALRYRKNSPFLITKGDKGPILVKNNKYLTDIESPPDLDFGMREHQMASV